MADINLGVGGANSAVAGGYDIANSVKLEPDNAEFLKRNQADGNTRTWTYSMWVKRTELGMSNGMALFYAGVYHQATRIFFDAGSDLDKLTIDLADHSTTQYRWITKRLFRDTSAWYHFVWRVDTTQSTATDRMRMYVNGVLLTADDFQQTATFPQNTDTTANDANLGGQQQMAIGNYSWANNNGIYAGYAAQCALVDGESLAPTEFGEFDEDSGIWKPKDISGLNYGTGNNSFLLDFEIASDLGANAKGNDANFTANNITSADQATDTPTNNFCIMNVLNRTNGNIKNQEGGTKVTTDGGSGWCSMLATMGVTKGKWYWESQRMSTGTPNDVITGIVGSEDAYLPYSPAANYYIGNVATSSSIGYYQKNYPSQEGSVINGVGLNFFSAPGDTIMFGLDMDNNKMYFGLNGTWLATSGTDSIGGNPARASTLHADFDGEFVLPGVSVFQGNNMTINFGGYAAYTISSAASDANGYGTFEYAPPSGYYALCTKNLAEYG